MPFKRDIFTGEIVEYDSNGRAVEVIARIDPPVKPVRSGGGKWPRESYAMGVDPEDVPQAMETARRHGVPTEYTPDGDPVLTSPGHQKRYMRVFGFYERNSYTDCPVNR